MRRTIITGLVAALVAAIVALPAGADSHAPTIVDIVTADDGEFDVLEAAVLAVESAGILPAATLLSSEGPFTVFAPTDKAFDKLAEDLSGEDFDSDDEVVGWLVANVGLETIADILTWHVVTGAVESSVVVTLDAFDTLGGELSVFYPGGNARSLQIVDNDPDSRNAKLVKGAFDIETGNGIIHVIDRVIRPFDL